MDLRDEILLFLERAGGRQFRTKELARTLRLPKQGPAYLRLKDTLRSLQDEALVTRTHGSHWAFAAGAPSEEPAAGSAPEPAPGREVVGVVKRFRRLTYVEPDGRDAGEDVHIPQRGLHDAEDGDLVVVRLAPARRGTGPTGEITEVLGRRGDPIHETTALARRFGFRPDFSSAVEDEVAALPAALPEEEIARRLDLRGLECFTIDPEDARDHDDAVSLEPLDDDTVRLGVHIADVSWYVRPGTALDREALRRGTSVYFPGTVFPMLPMRLSGGLCSLREGEDRFAYSFLATVSTRGVVREWALHKTVLRSRRRWTYEDVQAVLDGAAGPHRDTLLRMAGLARALLAARLRDGAIDFESTELRVTLDSHGHAIDIAPKERLESMRLIEEFMLLANRTVATGAFRRGGPFLYRVHDLPDEEKVRELRSFLSHLGIRARLDPNDSSTFQAMLAGLAGKPEADVVHDITIRAMAKAVYSERNIGHFGLGFPCYTHFTSPIRRYPDLVVHRLLHARFGGAGKDRAYAPGQRELAAIAEQSSIRERLAVDAERDAMKIRQAEYMRRHMGGEFDGVIASVVPWGLYVELLPSMVEGLVHVRTMQDDYYEHDKTTRRLTGVRRHRRYELGDRVRVRVLRADPADRSIDLEIL